NFRPEVGDEYYIDDVEWYVIADDDCISGLSPLTITVENCSSIDEKVNQSLNLYPNPTNDVLNFNGTNIFEYIQVIDNHGKVVLENNINSYKGKLDLSYLTRGIYFVKAFSNSGIIHKKIILN
ncbi:MAG: T9SS type A sorting domain-containing protein, partial [Flavobacteriales bacterium]|nr:T9SS type A sorting domain-containing protein [Flavobacteriales bacterium]